MPSHPVKPCSGCPFRRDIEPGYLGGSNPLVYVGQTQGPFVLNCHQAAGYAGQDTECVLDVPQCAGAAIFRANTGLCELMPPEIHRLPEDTETVFCSHEEFVAHHAQVTVEAVRRTFRPGWQSLCLHMELERQGVREAVSSGR